MKGEAEDVVFLCLYTDQDSAPRLDKILTGMSAEEKGKGFSMGVFAAPSDFLINMVLNAGKV